MSDAGDARPGAGEHARDEQFTVPVPAGPATQAIPTAGPPTQAIPAAEPTRVLPTFAPPVPPNPYAGSPVWPAEAARTSVTAGPVPTGAGPDPILGQVGSALFWMAVGWWAFVLVRVLGSVAREGVTDTLLIRTIDRGVEETLLAAALSVGAALLLLLGRGRSGRTPLAWTALGLAVLTVAVATWRVLP